MGFKNPRKELPCKRESFRECRRPQTPVRSPIPNRIGTSEWPPDDSTNDSISDVCKLSKFQARESESERVAERERVPLERCGDEDRSGGGGGHQRSNRGTNHFFGVQQSGVRERWRRSGRRGVEQDYYIICESRSSSRLGLRCPGARRATTWSWCACSSASRGQA
jgi:hypothetical protein